MRLYRTCHDFFIEKDQHWYRLHDTDWHGLTTRDDLPEYLESQISHLAPNSKPSSTKFVSPVAAQEVWAAGVTYYRSRTARMEESQVAGGGSFYDRVYEAERPELFFKGTSHRTAGPGGTVRIRKDSKWNVPEPELTLLLTSTGRLIGHTIGNDMSSRDIEGENPLYLPQAKVYDRSCALGPCISIGSEPLAKQTKIHMAIERDTQEVFSDSTDLGQMKRNPQVLVDYLFRDNAFPNGCFLLTGTGIVPPDSFTLESGDWIRISIDGIGTLENLVA